MGHVGTQCYSRQLISKAIMNRLQSWNFIIVARSLLGTPQKWVGFWKAPINLFKPQPQVISTIQDKSEILPKSGWDLESPYHHPALNDIPSPHASDHASIALTHKDGVPEVPRCSPHHWAGLYCCRGVPGRHRQDVVVRGATAVHVLVGPAENRHVPAGIGRGERSLEGWPWGYVTRANAQRVASALRQVGGGSGLFVGVRLLQSRSYGSHSHVTTPSSIWIGMGIGRVVNDG